MTIKQAQSPCPKSPRPQSLCSQSMPLPPYKYVPGINARPDCSFLESVADQACAVTEDASASSNVVWCYGIRLLNEGFYWESHEVLEAVWLNALPNSRERYLLQGIIHIANASLKVRMERAVAVARLQKMATECLERAFSQGPGPLMGLAAGQLNSAVDELRAGRVPESIRLEFKNT